MSKNKYVNLQLKYFTLLPTSVCLNTWSLFIDISLCALLISRPSYIRRTITGQPLHSTCTHSNNLLTASSKQIVNNLNKFKKNYCSIILSPCDCITTDPSTSQHLPFASHLGTFCPNKVYQKDERALPNKTASRKFSVSFHVSLHSPTLNLPLC